MHRTQPEEISAEPRRKRRSRSRKGANDPANVWQAEQTLQGLPLRSERYSQCKSQIHVQKDIIHECRSLQPRNPIRRCCSRKSSSGAWVDSNQAKVLLYTAILLNTIVYCLQSYVMEEPEFEQFERDPWLFASVEFCFFLFFFVELLLRLKKAPHALQQDRWTQYDAGLIMLCFVDTAVLNFLPEVRDLHRVVLHLMPALQILRLGRIIQELSLIIKGIYAAMHAVLWSMGLLFLVIYSAAVLCTSYISMSGHFRDDKLAHELFGNIGDAMLTLFTFATLEEFAPAVRYFLHDSWRGAVLGALILAFILFTNLALLNLVTAVMVDSIMAIKPKKRTERLAEERLEAIRRLEGLFLQMDRNDDRMLTLEEFQGGVKGMDDVKNEMSRLQIAEFDAKELFALIDFNCNGKVSVEEFVQGLLRATPGPATKKELMGVQYDIHKMWNMLCAGQEQLESRIEKGICEDMRQLMASLQHSVARTEELASWQQSVARTEEQILGTLTSQVGELHRQMEERQRVLLQIFETSGMAGVRDAAAKCEKASAEIVAQAKAAEVHAYSCYKIAAEDKSLRAEQRLEPGELSALSSIHDLAEKLHAGQDKIVEMLSQAESRWLASHSDAASQASDGAKAVPFANPESPLTEKVGVLVPGLPKQALKFASDSSAQTSPQAAQDNHDSTKSRAVDSPRFGKPASVPRRLFVSSPAPEKSREAPLPSSTSCTAGPSPVSCSPGGGVVRVARVAQGTSPHTVEVEATPASSSWQVGRAQQATQLDPPTGPYGHGAWSIAMGPSHPFQPAHEDLPLVLGQRGDLSRHHVMSAQPNSLHRVAQVEWFVKQQGLGALPFDRLVLHLDRLGVRLNISEQDLLKFSLRSSGCLAPVALRDASSYLW